MSALDLPEPLTPPDCDLQDFGFMPLHVGRLRDSELVDLSTGDEFKAAVLLWAFAWHQVPAGSLPDDDRILAKRSGAGEGWPTVKAMALRGFVQCSDGRLYHPIIAKAACDAWQRKDEKKAQGKGKYDRQKHWRADCAKLSALLRGVGIAPPQRPSKEVLVDMCRRHVPGFADTYVDAHVDAGVDTHVDATRDTDVDRQRVYRDTSRDARETAKTQTGTETQTNTHTARDGPPPSGVCVSDEKQVADAMRAAGMRSVDAGDPAIRELREKGATVAMFAEAAAVAMRKGKGAQYAFGIVRTKLSDVAAQPAAAPPAPVTVPSRPGPDPEVVRIEADRKRAVPPPPEIKARMQELRGQRQQQPVTQETP